jgi:hypothetical protein
MLLMCGKEIDNSIIKNRSIPKIINQESTYTKNIQESI